MIVTAFAWPKVASLPARLHPPSSTSNEQPMSIITPSDVRFASRAVEHYQIFIEGAKVHGSEQEIGGCRRQHFHAEMLAQRLQVGNPLTSMTPEDLEFCRIAARHYEIFAREAEVRGHPDLAASFGRQQVQAQELATRLAPEVGLGTGGEERRAPFPRARKGARGP